MTPRPERPATIEFTVTGPRSTMRGDALSREADEIAGIRARNLGATDWTYDYVMGSSDAGPDEINTHTYLLHLEY